MDVEVDCTSRVVKTVETPLRKKLDTDVLFTDDKVNLIALKEHFRREGRLHNEDVLALLTRASDLFREEDNVINVSSPITICGDTHGQLYDTFKLFEVGGSPDTTNYLFLGDYVDRGYFSCENLLYLYAHKINYPNSFFMLRGNHECRHLTACFTLKEECLVKYDVQIYEAMCDSFNTLPLAAIMNEQFFCVHGGLSPDVRTIADIQALDRFMEPPQFGPMCDLLWADPLEDYNDDPDAEYYPNDARGCSFAFGFRAACRFLDENDLLCIIRAHEAQDLGYKMYRKHDENQFPTLITLFSAPNYLDAYGNKGAVMRYENTVMNIRQFQHSPHPYWLPNFMDVITWSVPFVSEKVSDILLAILKMCDTEEPVVSAEKQREIKRAEIRAKILMLGKISKMYGDIQTERMAAVKLKGLTKGAAPITPTLLRAATDGSVIGNFKAARQMDRENERRPPIGPRRATLMDLQSAMEDQAKSYDGHSD